MASFVNAAQNHLKVKKNNTETGREQQPPVSPESPESTPWTAAVTPCVISQKRVHKKYENLTGSEICCLNFALRIANSTVYC